MTRLVTISWSLRKFYSEMRISGWKFLTTDGLSRRFFSKFVFFMKITDFKLKFPSKKYHENSYVQPGWRSLSLKSDKSMVISNFKCRKYPISTWNRQKNCQSSKNVKNYRFTRFEILAKKILSFSCPKVKSSPNPWIKILRFNSDDVL